MYYYILAPQKGKAYIRQEKIKDILGDLGIAGETVSPSPARTIEELTHLGVIKGYSTIVAVGPEGLANKVITVLASQKTAKNVVLGIIPDNFDSVIAQKIGVKDLYSACNALKERRLETMDICQIEPNKFFLTEAVVESFRNQEVYFSIDNLKGKVMVNQIVIKPGLEIFFHDKSLEGSTSSRFFRWLFGKKQVDIFSSNFRTKKIHLESQNNLPVKISGEIVAKIPVTINNRSRILKIIVARDKIKTKN